MSGKRKSASLAFYCFWHSWSGNARMLMCSERLCPTQKCHIQFRRHSIGSSLALRVERLLLFGSYFCGSGRSCGQNTELDDRCILGWLELFFGGGVCTSPTEFPADPPSFEGKGGEEVLSLKQTSFVSFTADKVIKSWLFWENMGMPHETESDPELDW